MARIEPHELAVVGWSWAFFFCVLNAYYVIRPIRDELGVAGGVGNLPWLITGTLAGMAAANPVFGYLAIRLTRPRLVSLSYRFFALNLVLFFLTMGAPATPGFSRVFFVWTAVFNMFAVSLFWSVMTDVFSTSQGARLFGLIGAGGTIGSIVGSGLTSTLVGLIGAPNLLLVSAVLLELAGFAARRIFRLRIDAKAQGPFQGSAWGGLTRTAGDSYLRGIALLAVLYSAITMVLYLQQATIVDSTMTDRVARTRFFANVDLIVNAVTLLTQSLATGWLVAMFGLTAALTLIPALSIGGFLALGFWPAVPVLMGFQVLTRSGEFAISRPAREVLFTAAHPDDRYRAKNFIDTFGYRAGDQLGAWSYALLAALGLGVPGTARIAAALCLLWVAVSVWLGRRAGYPPK